MGAFLIEETIWKIIHNNQIKDKTSLLEEDFVFNKLS